MNNLSRYYYGYSNGIFLFEPKVRIELTTFALRMQRSTN
jgi:hypothetical protein